MLRIYYYALVLDKMQESCIETTMAIMTLLGTATTLILSTKAHGLNSIVSDAALLLVVLAGGASGLVDPA